VAVRSYDSDLGISASGKDILHAIREQAHTPPSGPFCSAKRWLRKPERASGLRWLNGMADFPGQIKPSPRALFLMRRFSQQNGSGFVI
jgi:hypothetical protein